jgi:hypothetical protein
LEVGGNWLPVIEKLRRRGDLIVCHAEQRIPQWGVGSQSLAQALVSKLKIPTYHLSGFYPQLPASPPNRFVRLFVGALALLVLVGFFAIQVQIDQETKGWMSIVLLSFSVCAELGLFLAWQRLLS